MSWDMIGLIAIIPAFIIGYGCGRSSAEAPTEKEMIQRIIRERTVRKIREQVETELKNEMNRAAAGVSIPY